MMRMCVDFCVFSGTLPQRYCSMMFLLVYSASIRKTEQQQIYKITWVAFAPPTMASVIGAHCPYFFSLSLDICLVILSLYSALYAIDDARGRKKRRRRYTQLWKTFFDKKGKKQKTHTKLVDRIYRRSLSFSHLILWVNILNLLYQNISVCRVGFDSIIKRFVNIRYFLVLTRK